MCKKIKLIGISIAIAAISVLIFVVSRRNTDKRGVRDDSELIDDSTGRVEDLGRETDAIRDRIDASLEASRAARDHNKSAQAQLESAIRILKAAKDRQVSK